MRPVSESYLAQTCSLRLRVIHYIASLKGNLWNPSHCQILISLSAEVSFSIFCLPWITRAVPPGSNPKPIVCFAPDGTELVEGMESLELVEGCGTLSINSDSAQTASHQTALDLR